jgi:glycosyltransferase involved in cell wall biosynthesis
MRILMLNYEYPPLGGGAGVATEALARNLAGRGVMVDVVTAGAEDEQSRELIWNGSAPEEGTLTVYRVRCRRLGIHEAGMGGALSYVTAALPLVRQRLREAHYDAVHVFFSLPTGAMLPLLDLRGTPVVVSLRGSDVPGYDPHNRALQRAHTALLPFTRWIWRRADRVVALSDSLGRLARRSMPELRYAVIPNGVDLGRFRPPARMRAYRSDRVRCLAVARLVERKGLADLIRAIGTLDRGAIELEIVGSGPDDQVLRELVATLGLGDQVSFAGSLDRAALARRYATADLFTLASWEESFGNVFAEALAAGLPVVGTDVGGIPTIVRHGRNGLLVPPRDPTALAAAIEHLAARPLLRAEMARRNRADAEERLSWDQVATSYLSVYYAMQRRVPARTILAELPSGSW